MDEDSRRCKLIWVHPALLLNLRLFGGWRDGDEVVLHLLSGVPDGAAVHAVHYDPQRDALGFRVHHPSFDPVGVGCVIPDLRVTVREERVRVADAPPRGRQFI